MFASKTSGQEEEDEEEEKIITGCLVPFSLVMNITIRAHLLPYRPFTVHLPVPSLYDEC